MNSSDGRKPKRRKPSGRDGMSKRQQFCDWLDAEDVDWGSCTLSDITGRGQAVVATAYIAKDEVIISVPDDAVLMSDDCRIAEVHTAIFVDLQRNSS